MLQTEHQMRGKSKVWVAVLSVLAGVLILIGILAALALNDPNRGLPPAAPQSGALYAKLGAAALGGEPARLSADEVNSYLAAEYPGLSPHLSIRSDDSVDAYVSVAKRGMQFGLTANLTVRFDASRQQIVLQLRSFHVGRLPVPPGFALRFAGGRLPQGITAEEDALRADLPALWSGEIAGLAGLRLTDLKVGGGSFVATAAADPDKFREFIVQSLPDVFGFLK